MSISRRAFLGGALAGWAGGAMAQNLSPWAPETSSHPRWRPDGFHLRALPSAEDLIARANLDGRVACVVADARTGQVLEAVNPLLQLPPASVAKALTTDYALEHLGPGYRFRTRVMADGVVTNGRLEGDLWLVGGGDPLLDTDMLNGLSRDLADAGLREVTGAFRVAHGALPHVREIDPDQPAHVGYNPAISGLNLNFNRVHFEWRRAQSGGYDISMDARSENLRPPVSMARMRVADRSSPIYDFSESEAREEWSVARGALGDSGARWLPVRQPHLYAAEVFQVLCRSRGIVLRTPVLGGSSPEGALVLAEHVSDPLDEVLRGMMRWSTNLTAEVAGLSASQAAGFSPETLTGSAGSMGDWLRQRHGLRNGRLEDHSGLSEDSRISTREMVRALTGAGADGGLRRLMREIPMLDAEGNRLAEPPGEVVAKTGTLYFVSTLAGYVRAASGRDLAFAVFCADMPRRESFDASVEERPRGARGYNRRAKALQQALLGRWSLYYA